MPAAVAIALVLASVPLSAHAQGEVVRALAAAPVHRAGRAGSSPVALHPSGDVIVAAQGVLRAGPNGETRWHHADEDVVDVGTAPDGAIYGLALVQPTSRAGRVRLVRHRADGSIEWTHAFRERHDPFSIPQVEGAPDGGAWVCRSIARGPAPYPLLQRFDARGRIAWSVRLATEGQCHALDGAASGEIAWAGGRAVTRTLWAGVVERLDARGRVIWSQTYEGHPLIHEIALGADGSITAAGEFESDLDLIPGPAEQRGRGNGYTTFVTHFDPTGAPRWAWSSDRLEGAAAILHRGTDTILLGQGYMTRFDRAGRVVQREELGVPVHDGLRSVPFITVSGATLDARGELLITGGIPAPEAIGFSDYFLWTPRPYRGAHGAVLMRPGW